MTAIRLARVRTAGWPLAGSATVLLAGAAWFAWSLPAPASRRIRPAAQLGERWWWWDWLFERAAPPASSGRLGASLAAVTVAMFAAWAVMVWLTWERSDRRTVRVVVGLAAAATMIGVLALPNQTSDVYDYAAFGRVVTHHDGVPYEDLPSAHPDDPLVQLASPRYTTQPDNKLPAWTGAAVATTQLAGDSPLSSLLAFRILLGACTVATTALIAWILSRIRPGCAASGAAAFGLNPITIVYGTSKSDALMVLLLVAAIALVVEDRPLWATMAATCSVLVKLITAPVLVLLVLLPGRERGDSILRRAGGVAGRVAIVVAVVAAAYGPLPEPISLLRTQLSGTGRASVSGPLHLPALASFALLVVTVVVAGHRRPGPDAVARAKQLIGYSAPVLTVFAVALTRPGLPWYLLSCLAVVAMARSSLLVTVIGATSAASFLMGWWDAIGTRAYPLPELPTERAPAYLLVALIGAVLLVAHRRWSGSGAPERFRVASRSG